MKLPFAGPKKTETVDLDKIELAFPCPMKWDDMVGDERERFCSSCSLNVYNLSSMTKQEAEEFLMLRSEGRICLNFKRRKDGTVITENCPRALRAVRDRTRKIITFAANALLFCLSALCNSVGAQLPPTPWAREVRQPMDNGGYGGEPGAQIYPQGRPSQKSTIPTRVNNNASCGSKAEKAYQKRIDWFAKHKKTNTVDGARNYLDFASWYRSKGRLNESKNAYDKAIAILKLIPTANDTLENAILNRQAVVDQISKNEQEKLQK